MIDQVKGFSYSISSLLGASTVLPMIAEGEMHEESSEQENILVDNTKKSWWRISLATPKVQDNMSAW